MRKARNAALDPQRTPESAPPERARSARAAAESIRKMRKGRKLGGIATNELIEEGRR
jgi:hypothetical protein